MNKVLAEEKKINNMVHRSVAAALRELLSDPDRGFTLRPDFIRKIKKSLHSKEAGKVKSLKDVLAHHGF